MVKRIEWVAVDFPPKKNSFPLLAIQNVDQSEFRQTLEEFGILAGNYHYFEKRKKNREKGFVFLNFKVIFSGLAWSIYFDVLVGGRGVSRG